MSEFNEKVYAQVAAIPRGKVATYGGIAKACGKPRGAREVGWAMRNCPENLPWHRVVMADGCIAKGEWADMRRSMLEEEGIEILPDGKVDMAKHSMK